MSVKRYDLDIEACDGESGSCHAALELDPEGGFVGWEDHEPLVREIKALKRQNKLLRAEGANVPDGSVIEDRMYAAEAQLVLIRLVVASAVEDILQIATNVEKKRHDSPVQKSNRKPVFVSGKKVNYPRLKAGACK